MSWTPGADRVRELLNASELERVEASADVANRLASDAKQHVASAEAIAAAGDVSGAYSLAYDALRKSAASLLAVQGLRATSRGGHFAVQDTAIAQFGDTGAASVRSAGSGETAIALSIRAIRQANRPRTTWRTH